MPLDARDYNLLSNVKPEDMRLDPFPHVIIHNALPESVAHRLTAEYPPDEVMIQADAAPSGSNKRLNIYAGDVADSPRISPLWKQFIEEQSSPRFFRHAMRLFAGPIGERYPELTARFGDDLERARTGLRFRDEYRDRDVLLDAGISINTPVSTIPTTVRTAHLDLPTKLITGLYYLRPPEDQKTRGGDLVFCRYRDERKRLWRYDVDPACVEPIKTIPYQNNVLVLFLNTTDSLHEVTPRQHTRHTRKFVNLVVELGEPLFDGSQYQTARLPYRAKYYIRQLFSWLKV